MYFFFKKIKFNFYIYIETAKQILSLIDENKITQWFGVKRDDETTLTDEQVYNLNLFILFLFKCSLMCRKN